MIGEESVGVAVGFGEGVDLIAAGGGVALLFAFADELRDGLGAGFWAVIEGALGEGVDALVVLGLGLDGQQVFDWAADGEQALKLFEAAVDGGVVEVVQGGGGLATVFLHA